MKTENFKNQSVINEVKNEQPKMVLFLVNFIVNGKIEYEFDFKTGHNKFGFSLAPYQLCVNENWNDAKQSASKIITEHLLKKSTKGQVSFKKTIRSGDLMSQLCSFFILFKEVSDIHTSNSNQTYGIRVNIDLENPSAPNFTEIPSTRIVQSGTCLVVNDDSCLKYCIG